MTEHFGAVDDSCTGGSAETWRGRLYAQAPYNDFATADVYMHISIVSYGKTGKQTFAKYAFNFFFITDGITWPSACRHVTPGEYLNRIS
jgi:hypothetical protein